MDALKHISILGQNSIVRKEQSVGKKLVVGCTFFEGSQAERLLDYCLVQIQRSIGQLLHVQCESSD